MTTISTQKKTKFYTVVFMSDERPIPLFVRRYKSLKAANAAIDEYGNSETGSTAYLTKTDNRPTHSKRPTPTVTVLEPLQQNEVTPVVYAGGNNNLDVKLLSQDDVFSEVLEDEPNETVIEPTATKTKMPMMAQDNHVGTSKLDNVEVELTAKPKQMNFFSTIFGK